MSDTWTIKLTPEAEAVVRRLGDSPTILRWVTRAMSDMNKLVAGKISEQRLTGTGPFPVEMHKLGVRSGKLRQSLRDPEATEVRAQGGTIVGSIGTNMEYAAVHEFGFDGDVQVAPHMRRQTRTMTFDAGYSRLGKRKTVKKKVQGRDIAVRGHRRHMRVPARAPITTGVEESLDDYGQAISAAIVLSQENPT